MKDMYVVLFDKFFNELDEEAMGFDKAYEIASKKAYEALPDAMAEYFERQEEMAERASLR